MKFSICIPNFNYERYLGRTIQSVLDQNPDFEVLVSDNASTDRSVDVVRGFGDSRIRLRVNRCNVGFAGNLDRAAGMAEGTWMLMLSSDDLLRPGALPCYRALFNQLGSESENIVVSAAVDVIDADDQTTGRVGLPKNQVWRESDRAPELDAAVGGPVYRVKAPEMLRRCLLTMQNPFQFASTAYSRRLYEAVEGYGGNRLINPDKWFHWKLLAKAETAYFIDRPLAAYRWHNANQTAHQSKMGALKYLVDEYTSTFELDDCLLTDLGLDRIAIINAFVEHDIGRHGLAELAKGRASKARRIYQFGSSAYPQHIRRNNKVRILRVLLLLGPFGGLIARIAYARLGVQ